MSGRNDTPTVASTPTTIDLSGPLCDVCGSLRLPHTDVWRCRSCKATTRKCHTGAFVTTMHQQHRTVTVRTSDADRGLPTIDVDCSKCGATKAYWQIKQLRASDEAPTELYICTECSHTWRRD